MPAICSESGVDLMKDMDLPWFMGPAEKSVGFGAAFTRVRRTVHERWFPSRAKR
jgi:hypothetical protein